MLKNDELDAFIDELMSNRKEMKFSTSFVYSLIAEAIAVVKEDPILMKLNSPINICGDMHGQFLDLLRVFQSGGMPENSKYLFLGDYVDRGTQSLEVICLLYALKIKYPKQIYLIRGNHESPEMSEAFGFYTECCRKMTANAWHKFCNSFRYLPLGAIVDNKHFCIHGGLSPDFRKIELIQKFQRPLDIPDEGMLANLLWSDPDGSIQTWGPNDRGTTVCYGPIAAKQFLRDNHLETIIRGHQLAMDGYEYPFGSNHSVLTLFTASKYAGQCDNKAAFLSIDTTGEFTFTTLPSWNPVLSKKKETKAQPGTPRKKKHTVIIGGNLGIFG